MHHWNKASEALKADNTSVPKVVPAIYNVVSDIQDAASRLTSDWGSRTELLLKSQISVDSSNIGEPNKKSVWETENKEEIPAQIETILPSNSLYRLFKEYPRVLSAVANVPYEKIMLPAIASTFLSLKVWSQSAWNSAYLYSTVGDILPISSPSQIEQGIYLFLWSSFALLMACVAGTGLVVYWLQKKFGKHANIIHRPDTKVLEFHFQRNLPKWIDPSSSLRSSIYFAREAEKELKQLLNELVTTQSDIRETIKTVHVSSIHLTPSRTHALSARLNKLGFTTQTGVRPAHSLERVWVTAAKHGLFSGKTYLQAGKNLILKNPITNLRDTYEYFRSIATTFFNFPKEAGVVDVYL